MASNSKTNTNRNDVVFHGVLAVVRKRAAWAGTMTDLNSALVRVLGKKRSEVLPGSSSALRVVVNRVVNRLRNKGISVRFVRTSDHTRTRLVKFER